MFCVRWRYYRFCFTTPGLCRGLPIFCLPFSPRLAVKRRNRRYSLFCFERFWDILFCHFRLQKGTFRYKEYLAKRGRRILPPYYFCIIVSVLLVSGEYVSISGIKHVVLHLLCIHNLFPSAHGSINGALWTIGTIAQFYLIAPLLCKFFRKNGYITFLVTVVVTIAAKAGTYHFLYLSMETPGWYAFYAGRQLFTAIDNFAVGMFAAWLVQERSPGLKPLRAWVLIVTALLIQLFLCSFGLSHGIHTNNLWFHVAFIDCPYGWGDYGWLSLRACVEYYTGT